MKKGEGGRVGEIRGGWEGHRKFQTQHGATLRVRKEDVFLFDERHIHPELCIIMIMYEDFL